MGGSAGTNRRERSRSRQRTPPPHRGTIATISGGRMTTFPPNHEQEVRRIEETRRVKRVQAVLTGANMTPLGRKEPTPTITFDNQDLKRGTFGRDEPMVISIVAAEYKIERVLIDQGSSTNILYWSTVHQTPVYEVPSGEKDRKRVGRLPCSPKTTKIGTAMNPKEVDLLVTFLKANHDVFAWSAKDMPGVDPEFICHRLSIEQGVRPIAHKKRKQGEEKRRAAREEMRKLVSVGFVQEVQYPTWLANVVMVKKPSGKWRMCTDYTDLNKLDPWTLTPYSVLTD
ncbi:hypothetical protein CR513_15106, partial [Mucuna pruriens]